MRVDTLCSSYQELLLDIDIFGKLVSAPQVSREELKRVLFDEIHKTKPIPKLEDERYKLSKQVSEEYDITNDFEPELDDSEEVICLDDFIEDDNYSDSLPCKGEESISSEELEEKIEETPSEFSTRDRSSCIRCSGFTETNSWGSAGIEEHVEYSEEVEELEEEYGEYSDDEEDAEASTEYSDGDEDIDEEYNEYSDEDEEDANEEYEEYSDEAGDLGDEYSDKGASTEEYEGYEEYSDEDTLDDNEYEENSEDYPSTSDIASQESTDAVEIPPIVLPSLETQVGGINTSPPVVDNEPKDLLEFLRKYPRSEISFVLGYFSKKEIEKNLLTGRVVKRGSKLYF